MKLDIHLTALCKDYESRYGFTVLVTDPQGKIIRGEACRLNCACQGQRDERRKQAAMQTRYWGETVINLCCDSGFAMWGVPILCNNLMEGALVVQGVDLEEADADHHERVQIAASGLLSLAIERNLLNSAEVTLAKERAVKESDRFLAIEAAKSNPINDDLRSLYLSEEPNLLIAIKEERIRDARSILNRILTLIYSLAGERLELLKSCILELVVMMNRAAVEAGADPASVLGQNYSSFDEFSRIDDEEALASWVRRTLEGLIASIKSNDSYPHSLLLLRAINYMQSHLHEHLKRDQVARIAGISPSHFSRLVTERMGRSFSDLLTQMRITRAKEMLARTDKSLSEIAIECGFYDQSHFSKVFRTATSQSPGAYRK